MSRASGSEGQGDQPSGETPKPSSPPPDARPTDPTAPTRRDPARPSPAAGASPGASTSGASTPGVSTPGAPTPEPKPPVPFTQQVGRVALVVLAVLFVVFALANAQPVDFSWLFGESEVLRDSRGRPVSGGVPLIVLLIASFVLGALVTALAIFQVRRARSHRETVAKASRSGRRARKQSPSS